MYTVTAAENPATAIAVCVIAGILLCLYFLPAIIAMFRDHINQNSIAVLNFFLGWTFIGWVISLVWAVSYFDRVARKATKVEDSVSRREREERQRFSAFQRIGDVR